MTNTNPVRLKNKNKFGHHSHSAVAMAILLRALDNVIFWNLSTQSKGFEILKVLQTTDKINFCINLTNSVIGYDKILKFNQNSIVTHT